MSRPTRCVRATAAEAVDYGAVKTVLKALGARRVLMDNLSSDASDHVTFELVAERAPGP